jgi:hypothetical protein
MLDFPSLVWMLVSALIGSSVAAIFLKCGCTLYNMMAGGAISPRSVPEPSFLNATGIYLTVFFVGVAMQYVIESIWRLGWDTASRGGPESDPIFLLIAVGAGILVLILALMMFLPTTFLRAVTVMLVTWAFFIVGLVTATVVLVAVGQLVQLVLHGVTRGLP